MDGMTPADLAAVFNNQNCGNGTWWLLILFVFMMGNGGWNRGDYGQYATASSQQEILFGQQFQNIDNKIDRIGNGLADLGYALTNNIHNAQDILGGAIGTEGRNIQMQLAQCCCDNKEATAQMRYDMANFAAQINSNIDNKFAALEKAGLEQTIAAQNARINQLELNSALCGVVRYPTYATTHNPFCNTNNGNCCNGGAMI